MSRPGGNPEFGKQYRFPCKYDKPLSKKALQIRLKQSVMEELMLLPRQERLNLVREAIALALNQRKETIDREKNGNQTD